MSSDQKTSPQLLDLNNLRLYEGKLWEVQDTGLLQTLVALDVPACRSPVNWKGSLIPLDLWRRIVSFMRWGYKERNSEVHITLYYNERNESWAAWAYPQELGGMTVSTIDCEAATEQRKQFGNDWIELGSIHHHCSMSAFQSGTDKNDEEERDGLHITLGHMDKEEMDIDVRVVFDKQIFAKQDICDWIEEPEWLDQKVLSNKLYFEIYRKIILQSECDDEFPEIWKTNCRKKVYSNPVNFNNKNALGRGYGFGRYDFFHNDHDLETIPFDSKADKKKPEDEEESLGPACKKENISYEIFQKVAKTCDENGVAYTSLRDIEAALNILHESDWDMEDFLIYLDNEYDLKGLMESANIKEEEALVWTADLQYLTFQISRLGIDVEVLKDTLNYIYYEQL